MQRSIRSAALIAAGVVLAACTDRPTAAPTAPRLSLTGTACNWSKMEGDARRYFSSPAAALTLVGQMFTAYGSGGAAGATPLALDIAKKIEAALATNGAIAGQPSDGANLVIDLVACSTLTVQTSQSQSGLTPLQALTKALSNGGLFGVRGNDGTDGATSPLIVRNPGGPYWGTEPDLAIPTTWGGSTNARIIIFGYELTTSPLSIEMGLIAPNNNAAFTFNPPVRVGGCVDPSGGVHVQHITSLLAYQPVSFCSQFGAATPTTRGGFLASARRVWDAVMPQPLYAATFALVGVGGKAGDYSPFYFGPITASTTTWSFTTQPTDGRAETDIPVAVQVMSTTVNPAGGGVSVPLVGMAVTLQIYGNNGSWKVFNAGPVLTDANGIATFPHFQISKPGGYRLVAVVVDNNYTATSPTSNLFNLQKH